MRRTTLPLLALIGSLGLTTAARAGCCDDFWSCLGAVATGGLTCEIQGIVDTVQALKVAVDKLANNLHNQILVVVVESQASATKATDDVKQIREQCVAELQKIAVKAHELATAKPPPTALQTGLVAPAAHPQVLAARPGSPPPVAETVAGAHTVAPLLPKVADPKAAKEALARGDSYLQDLKNKQVITAGEILNAEKQASDAIARHLATAQQIGMDTALAPLRLLDESLLDLLNHPERIFDPSAQIEAAVLRVVAEVPALLGRVANEVTQEGMGDLEHVKLSVQQVQDATAGGAAVLDRMKKLSDSHLQADLDALDRLLPKQATVVTGMGLHAIALPVGILGQHELVLAAFSHTEATKLPTVVLHKAAVDDISAKWAAIKLQTKVPAKVDAPTQQRVDHDLGQMFAGKPKGDADKKRQELQVEAKKHYANDPKTLEKVRLYLEAHAKA